jgi:hypothetical protein
MRQSEPVKKIDLVRDHISAGRFKKALAIVKTFRPLRGGATKADIDTMTRAYECMTNPRIYAQMGVDPDVAIADGIKCATALYGQV